MKRRENSIEEWPSVYESVRYTAAIEHSPLVLRKGIYNWICSHFRIECDCYAAAIFFNAGYIAGIKAERARRKRRKK